MCVLSRLGSFGPLRPRATVMMAVGVVELLVVTVNIAEYVGRIGVQRFML